MHLLPVSDKVAVSSMQYDLQSNGMGRKKTMPGLINVMSDLVCRSLDDTG